MSENTAITAKDNLKKALKEGKSQCGAIAANLNKIISEGLLEFFDLPGDNPCDRLHALITLPLNKGGLNCKIHEVDALLAIQPSVQRKFRDLVHAAKQGERNDLVEEPKVEVKISEDLGDKDLSDTQKATDRAVSRAVGAVPQLDELLDEGLISKHTAAKLGKKVKDSDSPTDKEREIIFQQEIVASKLDEIVPDPLPTEAVERKKIKKQVKEAIEQATGKVSKPKITLSEPQKTAKSIVEASADLEYLQELMIALELEIEEMMQFDLLAQAA